MTHDKSLQMRLYRNVKYHEDRYAHYERLNRWSNFFVVVFGSVGIGSGLASWALVAAAVAAATTVLGAMQLVFDIGNKARTHQELRKSMVRLMARAEQQDADAERINVEMIELYADEPEIYHAVNMLAYNAAQRAFGRPDDTLIRVTPWQSAMRHILRFDPADFGDMVTR